MMTWPYWSTARYRYRHRPATLTYVSSTNQRSPIACRSGRAAGEQRNEPLHAPIHRHVVDLDAALGQQLFHIPI
jgi:hypothetical protein